MKARIGGNRMGFIPVMISPKIGAVWTMGYSTQQGIY